MGTTCKCQGHTTTCPDHTIAICVEDTDGYCRSECINIPGLYRRIDLEFALWARNLILSHAFQVINTNHFVGINSIEFDRKFSQDPFEFIRRNSQTVYFNDNLKAKINFSIKFSKY